MKRRRYVIESSARTQRSASEAFKIVTDPRTWPRWQSEIVATDADEPLQTGGFVYGRAKMLGLDVQGRSDAVEVADGVFREDVIVGVRMHVTYRVEPDGDGARVIHRLESELPRGAIGSILSLLLRWRLRKLQVHALERLANPPTRPRSGRPSPS